MAVCGVGIILCGHHDMPGCHPGLRLQTEALHATAERNTLAQDQTATQRPGNGSSRGERDGAATLLLLLGSKSVCFPESDSVLFQSSLCSQQGRKVSIFTTCCCFGNHQPLWPEDITEDCNRTHQKPVLCKMKSVTAVLVLQTVLRGKAEIISPVW